MDRKHLSYFSPFQRVLPNTRRTVEHWCYISNTRLKTKEGGEKEEKEETESKNSSTTSGQHNRSALNAIFYFTTVPTSSCLSFFSHLFFFLSHSFCNMWGWQKTNFFISMCFSLCSPYPCKGTVQTVVASIDFSHDCGQQLQKQNICRELPQSTLQQIWDQTHNRLWNIKRHASCSHFLKAFHWRQAILERLHSHTPPGDGF